MNAANPLTLILATTPERARALADRILKKPGAELPCLDLGAAQGRESLAGFSACAEPTPPAEWSDRFLRDMLALHDALAQANGHNPLWWATDLASRNRFTSPLLPLLNALARALAVLERAAASGPGLDRQGLVICGLPAGVEQALAEHARRKGWRVETYGNRCAHFVT
ncbi:MAG: hypothetical protein C0405_10605, partial [Desulfovibrio sp.]|nr:hypothetical protein [Desulfovibrio sp.]